MTYRRDRRCCGLRVCVPECACDGKGVGQCTIGLSIMVIVAMPRTQPPKTQWKKKGGRPPAVMHCNLEAGLSWVYRNYKDGC